MNYVVIRILKLILLIGILYPFCLKAKDFEEASKYVKVGEVMSIEVSKLYFTNKEDVWLRAEVHYTSADFYGQKVFILPMKESDSHYMVNFQVPNDAAKLTFSFCTPSFTLIDSVHTRVLDKNGKLQRRASLPYILISDTVKAELLLEKSCFPDSYEVYKYLWILEFLKNGRKAYLDNVKKDVSFFKKQTKKNPELYYALIEGLIALEDYRLAIKYLKRFSFKFPNSYLFFSAFGIIEKFLIDNNYMQKLSSIYDFAAFHLFSISRHPQAFENAYILVKGNITRQSLEEFIKDQENAMGKLVSPLLYLQAEKAATKNSWHDLASEYAKKLLFFAYTEKDLPNFYVDRTLGGAFQNPILDNMYKRYLSCLLNAKQHQDIITETDREQKNRNYDASQDQLYFFKGIALMELGETKDAERSFFRSFLGGNKEAKNELRRLYFKKYQRKKAASFEKYFKNNLKKYHAR